MNLKYVLRKLKENGIHARWIAQQTGICERSLQLFIQKEDRQLSIKNQETLTEFLLNHKSLWEGLI